MAETKIQLVVQTLSKAEIEGQISEKVNHLKELQHIDCEEVRNFAYETVTKSKKQIKTVETERKKITSVLDLEKKKYMEFEKEMVSEITVESDRVAKLVQEYDKEQIEKANKEQELFNQKMEEQRQVVSEIASDVDDWFGEPAPNIYHEVVPVPNTVIPKGTTTTKNFRLVDFSKVPDMFKVLNETKIRQAMKDGIPVVGIEYFEEQKTTFR